MALTAHLDASAAAAGKRRALRKQLRLETSGATRKASVPRVLIHNISKTGLLLESAVPLKLNEPIDVDLPEAGMTAAKVIWKSDDLYGCQFDAAISAATLGAAQLKGAAMPKPDAAGTSPRTGETFGARLQRLRHGRGLTLAQIAGRLGVSKPTVWAWEKDRVKPAGRRIEALAEALGVPAADLLFEGDISALEGLLARTRSQIAAAYGTSAENVRIMIDL